MKQRSIGLALVLALAWSSAANALDKVTFRLDWVPGAEFAPFYLGKEKGFFAEQGIDLQICLLYTSPSPRDRQKSRMPSSA